MESIRKEKWQGQKNDLGSASGLNLTDARQRSKQIQGTSRRKANAGNDFER
jgi:hypothetical protein